MSSDRVINAFFSLLQAGLWSGSGVNEDLFPLTDKEWNELYNLSNYHTVEGIVFDGVEKLPSQLLPNRQRILHWLVRTEKIEQRNLWMNTIIAEQNSFFTNNNVQPLLLKGQGLASIYDNPYRRMSGDIDWSFLSKKQYKLANRLIIDSHITLENSAGHSKNYLWKNCEIEHHSKIVDVHNPLSSHFISKFLNKEYAQCGFLKIDNQSVLIPSPLVVLLQTNMHILKHLLSFGIGLRQLCDSARCYSHYDTLYDKKELSKIYSILGVSKWVNLLHLILVKKLGLPESSLPMKLNETEDYHWMLQDVIDAGNFGFFWQEYREKESQSRERVESFSRIFKNISKYMKVAPSEAFSFPITHYLSRWGI